MLPLKLASHSSVQCMSFWINWFFSVDVQSRGHCGCCCRFFAVCHPWFLTGILILCRRTVTRLNLTFVWFVLGTWLLNLPRSNVLPVEWEALVDVFGYFLNVYCFRKHHQVINICQDDVLQFSMNVDISVLLHPLLNPRLCSSSAKKSCLSLGVVRSP